MSDTNIPNQIGAPSRDGVVLTPRADGELPFVPRAIYVHADGDLDWQGQRMPRHTTPVYSGQIIPIQPTKIFLAGTTATVEIWT